MCHIADYYDFYERHAGGGTRYHDWFIKRARDLLDIHRATCPECADVTRSNFNLAKPRTLTYRMRGAK